MKPPSLPIGGGGGISYPILQLHLHLTPHFALIRRVKTGSCGWIHNRFPAEGITA